MKQILTVAILGAGSRGAETYGRFFHYRKDMFKILSLCEVKKERLERYQKEFEVEETLCFKDEKDFFKEKRADLLVIATQDQDHVRQALVAIELGYHILLEKPITNNEEELYQLYNAASKKNIKILVCHVLRYGGAYQKVKEILDNKLIGDLISIDHLEGVGYWHQAHSFVRGNWRRKDETSPMILAKCCHDLDLITWFANSECDSITSFGSLNYFDSKHAPKEATKRCSDCPLKESCCYSAYNLYVKRWEEVGKPDNTWPFNVLTEEKVSKESLTKAIETGPYGRCVFYCDNDVVDSQSTNILFKNGVTANLKMTAFVKYGGRYIHFYGTLGEMILDEHEDVIKLWQYGKEDVSFKISTLTIEKTGHGGSDERMMKYLYEVLTSGEEVKGTTLEASIQSHMMAFASEKSRLEKGKIIKM